MPTVLHDHHATDLPDARADGEALWLNAADIETGLGWQWKPEGLCKGERCVPLPRRADAPIVRGDRLDVAALWRHTGQPVVHDADGAIWSFGTGAEQRAQALESLQAPDFTLPDLDGRPHALSDHRGRKVLLVSWASW